MNYNEYLKTKNDIDEKYQADLHNLRMKYVIDNKKFNVGDFIFHVTGIIKVERISYEIFMDSLDIIYDGYRYKKNKGVISRTKDNKMSRFRESHNVKLLKQNNV